jgi:ribosome-binding protein aMBF1 (putative translation factor)
MKCKLCDEEIKNYDSSFHNVQIDDKSVDICSDCMDAIVKWQGQIYSKLYPTKTLKKRFEK